MAKVYSNSRVLHLDYDYLVVPLDSGSFPDPMCPSAKPVTALTVSFLLGLGIPKAATRTSTLVLQGKNYDSLRTAIDLDIEKIESSISHLQESLTVIRSSTAELEGYEVYWEILQKLRQDNMVINTF